MKGIDAIAEILKREGIEFLACYPSQPLIDACARRGIRPVLCRQERIGMAIADGFSRTTNGKRLGVFTMQQGPGSENAFPGAAQAFADNVPILLLPGGEFTHKAFVKPNFSAMDSYGSVTKWMAQINHMDRIPELMRRAFYQLRTGKGGPVLLELPRDVMEGEYGSDEVQYTAVNGNRTAPDPQDIREAARILLQSNRPVIHAGQGVMYAEATEELRELAELLQAPVMTTMPGKGAFPENHPLALGASAVSTTKPISHFLQRADTVFGVGCSFTRTAYGKTIPDGKLIIHSTIDPSDVNKDYEAGHAVIGDAKLVLQELVDEIRSSTAGGGREANGTVAEEVQTVKKEWLDEWMPELTSDEIPINPYRVIWDMLHTVDRANTIITHDAGSPRDQLVPFWETVAPRTYMGWGKSTQLGHGLGLIMGAKLAEPGKLCINVMGDAAIGMVGMDLETAARSKLSILTVVWNNGAMAIERDTMEYATEKYGTVFVGGNYSEVSRALGGWSERVEKPDDFIPAFKRAIEVTKTGQPALVEVITKEGFDFSKYP